jgi:hypothetical protein
VGDVVHGQGGLYSSDISSMPNPSSFRKYIVIALAALFPFAVLPPLTAWSADRLAKAGAARWRTLSSDLEVVLDAARRSSAEEQEPSGDIAVAIDPSPFAFATARSGSDRVAQSRARRPRRIFVGPSMIRRAIPSSARPKSAWTDRDGDRPAGMLIQSPGVLAGTILAGDVLFEAEGRPIGSFEQLVSIVGDGYRRKTKFLSGRLYRKGETWAVTVEPGW